jgi:inhibitor of cysteine peptidase
MRRFYGLVIGMAVLGVVQSQAGEDKGVTITDKADKGKVNLSKGSILTVKLAGNPTTGFQWVIAKNNKDELSPQGKSEYVRDGKAIGGGGHFVLKFKAEKACTSELELEYKRPFEKDKAAAKTFNVKVVIE